VTGTPGRQPHHLGGAADCRHVWIQDGCRAAVARRACIIMVPNAVRVERGFPQATLDALRPRARVPNRSADLRPFDRRHAGRPARRPDPRTRGAERRGSSSAWMPICLLTDRLRTIPETGGGTIDIPKGKTLFVSGEPRPLGWHCGRAARAGGQCRAPRPPSAPKSRAPLHRADEVRAPAAMRCRAVRYQDETQVSRPSTGPFRVRPVDIRQHASASA